MASARADWSPGAGLASKCGSSIDTSSPCRDGGVRASTYRVPFPDNEPRRRVHFAKLPRNALPLRSSERPPSTKNTKVAGSPNNTQRDSKGRHAAPTSSTPVSTAVQNIRRQAKWKVDQGPPSPTKSLGIDSRKLRGLATCYLPQKDLLKQWVAAHSSYSKQDEEAPEVKALSSSIVHESRQTPQGDYDLYLYLASKYGALDGVAYCSSPSPGRTYWLLVDAGARRLQRWSRRQMRAHRRYWVVHLAETTAALTLDKGLIEVSRCHRQEQIALAHRHCVLKQRAARALQRWHSHSRRMSEVETRFTAAIDRELCARFSRWRGRTTAAKQFKRQLKTVVRRKAMAHALDQWLQWKQRHEKMRHHLCRRWRKTQQECLGVWVRYARAARASRSIQRSWRMHQWRLERFKAAALLTKVVKGCLSRSRVRELRQRVEVGRVVIGLVEQLVWTNYHSMAVKQRKVLLEKEIARVEREHTFVMEAEQEAETRMNRDLRAVVRNAMHKQLQDTMKAVRESQVSRGNIQVLKNQGLLRSLAAEQLAVQHRERTRAEATSAFRCASDGNRPLEGCLLCLVKVGGELPLGCLCSVEHECVFAEAIRSNTEGVREHLDRLEATERAHAQACADGVGRRSGQVHSYVAVRWPAEFL